MLRVKICGIGAAEDASTAVEAGANALGFNFWTKSPRHISPAEAARIIETVPTDVWKVGVFVDEPIERVMTIAAEAGIDAVQLHGSEGPDYWGRLHFPRRIKAFKVGRGFELAEISRFDAATAFLLDASVAGMVGGTGRVFDWTIAQEAKQFGNILLAGGLRPHNVKEAIRTVHPWGVDVCSGVESAPGKKDLQKIRDFVRLAREAETEMAEKFSR